MNKKKNTRSTDSHIPQSLIEQGVSYGYMSSLPGLPGPIDRASPLLREIARKIHRENGPAIYLNDGTALYFWNGMHVPQHVIEDPESITIDEILSAENIEYKRILIERFGQGKFLATLGGKKIQEDHYGVLWLIRRERFVDNISKQLVERKIPLVQDPSSPVNQAYDQQQLARQNIFELNLLSGQATQEQRYREQMQQQVQQEEEVRRNFAERERRSHVEELTQTLFGDLRRTKFVQVQDATTPSETFFIQVPNYCKSAKQAIAWSFSLKESQYEPQIQT